MTTLESTFDNNTILDTKKTKVRVSNEIHKDDAVEVYFRVDLSGTKVRDAIDNDYNVTLAGAIRKSFLKGKVTDEEAQELLKEWAEKNATEEDPYVCHVDHLGKMIVSKEQRKAEVKAGLSALKASMSEEEFNALVSELD